jgi:starch synthase
MTGQVLSVASECVPLVKTGGLADVVGALPKALAPRGWRLRTLIPAYPGLAARLGTARTVWEDADLFGGPARVLAGTAEGLDLLLLDAPHLYERTGGIYGVGGYDHADNPERFAALGWAAARIAADGTQESWKPDIVHAHDWQAGLAPAYLRYDGTGIPSIITVHNIAFQGLAPADRVARLRLPPDQFHAAGYEYYGQISTLKAALVNADAITTVSPTYAGELMRDEFGMGLQGVINERAADVSGILNGTDIDVWNPAADPSVTAFSAKAMAGKARNRAAILAEFGLADVPGPLVIVVSRLTHQKGIDLLPLTIPAFVEQGGGLIVLGSGDGALEEAMRALSRAHPGRVGVKIGYDEALSHRLFGGGDAVLVPSRFEPCGLTQMYGLRYGTIPVVAATGGLADTVVDANRAALSAGVATGIVFHPTDGLGLALALRRLVALHADARAWAQVQKNAMKADVSWDASSAAYAALYERLTA